LEAHHPAEYYASLLGDTDKAEKVAPLMRGIISKGYRIVPPHVNESGVGYDVSMGPDCKAIIYMGLASIRSVGESADAIVTEREKNGKFGSFIEFCQRLPSVNKTVKVNLVKAGAFDWDNSICNRDKIDNVDIINKIIRRKNKKFDGSKVAPVQIAMECYITGNDYTDIQKQQNEREVLHSFITGHPAAVYQRLAPYLERQDTFVVCPSMLRHCVVGQSVLLVGMVDAIKKKTIQKEGRNQGRPYLVITVSDNEDIAMFNVWWPMCDEMEKYLVTGQVAMFECVTKEDKFREGMLTLNVKHAIMLSHGLPVQGVFCVNGCDPTTVVTKVGGIVQDIMNIGGGNQYVSIRGGRITVMPDILDNVVTEFGGNVKFLVSMEALEHKS
jgi:DNA polymerase III alpha subunit